MGTFSALLVLFEENPPVTGGFHSQRASNAGFDVSFDVGLNKRLSKQSSTGDLRRYVGHCDDTVMCFATDNGTVMGSSAPREACECYEFHQNN